MRFAHRIPLYIVSRPLLFLGLFLALFVSPHAFAQTAPTKPTLTVGLTSRSGVSGQPFSFVVEAVGTAPLAFQWSKNGKALAGQTRPSLDFAKLAPTDAGAYSVRVSNALGSVTGRATLRVLVPPAFVQPLVATTALVSDRLVLTTKAGGTAPLTYKWFKDGVSLDKQTKSTLTIAKAALTDAGTYSVTVANATGLPATSSARLDVVMPKIGLGLEGEWLMVRQGVVAPLKLTVSRAPAAYRKAIRLSITGLPPGVTASFAPASLSAKLTGSVLGIKASLAAPVGSYNVTVLATGPDATAAAVTFPLYITPAPPSKVAGLRAVQPWGELTPLEMETTNAGVYVRAVDTDGNDSVWRGTADWTSHTFDDSIYSWRPADLYDEAPDEFGVAWVGYEKFGLVYKNNGSPSFTYDKGDMSGGGLPYGTMDDYLPGDLDWAITEDLGIFFDTRTGSDASDMFSYVDRIPDLSVVLRDPEDDATLYVGGQDTLYEVTPFGTTDYDLSAYGSDESFVFVNKLEHTRGRLWISYNGKILTLHDGVVSLFADASNAFSYFGLGNFCIANGHVYASNGLRYPLSGGPGVPWIKDKTALKLGSPEFNRYAQIFGVATTGKLYALKNAVSSSIYILAGEQLFIIDPL